ncbi:Fe-S cluster assembly protein SufD [Flexithrix dorotheae]|uniref:Fe-S cluster assembly protein SufD n=1 Tax=Flexithrix dorotheae TaxID=70993 RepID=UPI0003714D39|nr:Fe-S cluster assembly protein SufD [Flexithrix dorotheae]
MNDINLVDLKKGLKEQFDKFQGNINGQGKLAFNEVRKHALQQLEKIQFPTVKDEEWKYTNVQKILKHEFAFDLPSSGKIQEIESYIIPDLDAHRLVFVNGKLSEELSEIGQENGLTVLNIKDAQTQYGELVNEHLSKYAAFEEDAFTALSTAFTAEGAFIKVDKNKIIEKPILIFNFTDSTAANAIAMPRNLVIAEENAQVTVIEDYAAIGDNYGFINSVTEFKVSKNAIVHNYKLQNKSDKNFFIGTTQVHQEGDSHYNNTTITLGGDLVRNNLNILLDGEHCEAFMNGLYLLKDKHHVDNHSMVDHLKPNSYSNELYKGIMDGESKGVFNGKIFVRPDAQKTNAFQENKNILLSDKASIDTKPQLEIWADDVKCSHGATTGALDEEPVFYLRSRGIDEDKAKALLMFAFANDVLERIKSEPFKNHVAKLIGERLKQEI